MDTHSYNEHQRSFVPLTKKCAFCPRNNDKTNLEDTCYTSVYNVQNRTNVIVYRNVRFSEIKIGMPRCEKCRSVHSKGKLAVNLCLFIGIPLVFIIPIWGAMSFDFGTIGMIVMMAMTFGLVYLAMISVDKAIFDSYDVKSEKDAAMKEPLIREFLRNGWSLERPTA